MSANDCKNIRLSTAIILAAGEGTRMKSSIPKVLHNFCGKTFLQRVISNVRALNPDKTAVVVRHEAQKVSQAALSYYDAVQIVKQDEKPGTGRAVQCAVEFFGENGGLGNTVLITASDMPLLSADVLRALYAEHAESGNAATVLTAEVGNPFGYGRIIRNEDGSVAKIVEEADANDRQKAIREVNTSVYLFNAQALEYSISRLNSQNAQNEFYLTDALASANEFGRVGAYAAPDPLSVAGVNDRVQLCRLAKEHNLRICEQKMREGADIADPATTWIEEDVVIGPDAQILPGSFLKGKTVVGKSAVVGPYTTLIDATVDESAVVERSRVESAHIGANANIGPWTYLRPGSDLGENAKAGAFVEMKKAVIDEGSKVPHLSYIGDAHIGSKSNVGGGTITANYDGVHKSRTEIGSGVHIGAGNMLVAPVNVGNGVTTGAGSVVRKDINDNAMAYSENSQHTVENWKPVWERGE